MRIWNQKFHQCSPDPANTDEKMSGAHHLYSCHNNSIYGWQFALGTGEQQVELVEHVDK